MLNNKKLIFIAVLISILIFIIFISVTFFYLRKSEKIPIQKNYLNIDMNRVIENPTTEDMKNLIEQVSGNVNF